MSARILSIAPDMAEDVARDIGHRMRYLDTVECRAHDIEPVPAVAVSIEHSLYAEAVWAPEWGYVAAWGVIAVDAVGGPAYLWLLTAHDAPRFQKQLLRHGKQFVKGAIETYGTVEAQVLKSYDKSVRMLRRWGFTMDETVIINGHEFYTARRKARTWASQP